MIIMMILAASPRLLTLPLGHSQPIPMGARTQVRAHRCTWLVPYRSFNGFNGVTVIDCYCYY